MSIKEQIISKLEDAFSPQSLEVIDDSAKHAGHYQNPAGGAGESHFTVKLVSEKFAGKPRLARHRLVNAALAEELAGPVHALAIVAQAPGE